MIRIYKLDGIFDSHILSLKGFVESYRVDKEGKFLEIIGDGRIVDADDDLKKLSAEYDSSKTAVIKWQ